MIQWQAKVLVPPTWAKARSGVHVGQSPFPAEPRDKEVVVAPLGHLSVTSRNAVGRKGVNGEAKMATACLAHPFLH